MGKENKEQEHEDGGIWRWGGEYGKTQCDTGEGISDMRRERKSVAFGTLNLANLSITHTSDSAAHARGGARPLSFNSPFLMLRIHSQTKRGQTLLCIHGQPLSVYIQQRLLSRLLSTFSAAFLYPYVYFSLPICLYTM